MTKIDLSRTEDKALYVVIKHRKEGERIAHSVPLHDMANLDLSLAASWDALLGEAYIVCDLNDAGELLGLDITL